LTENCNLVWLYFTGWLQKRGYVFGQSEREKAACKFATAAAKNLLRINGASIFARNS